MTDTPKKHPNVNRGNREFDKTQLKSAPYGYYVHRDYAAHFFRWGFAKNYIKNGMSVLEIGCGQEMPLTRVLTENISYVPSRYVGCDLNKIKAPLERKWISLLDQFDFISRHKEIDGTFDVVVCFEVIEHMEKNNGRKLLKAMMNKLSSKGVMIISTPVYNEKHMAANHIHEYRFDELKDMIEEVGLSVKDVFGTFMTSHSMKKVCSKEEMQLIERLHNFYSWDVLANFIAPKYPEHSSNCCWVLTRGEKLTGGF